MSYLNFLYNWRLWVAFAVIVTYAETYACVHQVTEVEQDVKPMRERITAEERSTVKFDQKVEEWEVIEYYLQFLCSRIL